MNFLQPALLAALPLAALPLLIHLIHQRRYQSVSWGGMMFLSTAQGTSRGHARIRRWLILLFRTLAILMLIVALSRPLASGSLGSALGGRADVVIVLLDRSPSMQQRDPATQMTKLDTARDQLMTALRALPAARWVWIDATTAAAQELASPAAISDRVLSGPVDASADIPAMLRAAQRYIADTRPGSADIWIASDLRCNDWNPDSDAWPLLRSSFDRLASDVRLHLLTYPQPAPHNLALRISNVRRASPGGAPSLLVSLQLERPSDAAAEPMDVPIRIEVQDARTEVTATLSESMLQWTDHPIPLDAGVQRGWGRISLPADTNVADNEWYFAFDNPPMQHTVIVSDDPSAAGPLQLAASIAPDRYTECTSEIIDAAALAAVDWDNTGLLLWQGNLPEPPVAGVVERFVANGGRAVFFPPRYPSVSRLFGVGWGNWHRPAGQMSVGDWRRDHDLLADTLGGDTLPVDRLQIYGYASVLGPITPLASLSNGAALLARAATPAGSVYFCATTPRPDDSSLATDGVVLYVAIQRALRHGAAARADGDQLTAGAATARATEGWRRLSGPNAEHILSSRYGFHRGVYGDRQRQRAVNRAAAEDETLVVSDARLSEMLGDIRWTRVDDSAGSVSPLIQEIWRMFLMTAMLAMLLEAGLSLPRRAAASGSR